MYCDFWSLSEEPGVFGHMVRMCMVVVDAAGGIETWTQR